jgi:hypothetical protein
MGEVLMSKPKVIALDLDGTVLRYDGNFERDVFGDALPGMTDELNMLRSLGCVIVIWTCRKVTDALRGHLRAQDIPYDYINGHPWERPNSRKMSADVYIDDRAYSFRGVVNGLASEVITFTPWWETENIFKD